MNEKMKLKIIELDNNKSDEIYSSDNCQLLLNTYAKYYIKTGFRPFYLKQVNLK